MLLFYQVLQNGNPNAHDIVLSNMTALFDRVLLDVQVPPYILIPFTICSDMFVYVPRWPLISSFTLLQNPFTFPPYHKAIREPFDYYMFGQNYIRPLVDFR
jgi:glycerol-3-phosphate O-acyltransferase